MNLSEKHLEDTNDLLQQVLKAVKEKSGKEISLQLNQPESQEIKGTVKLADNTVEVVDLYEVIDLLKEVKKSIEESRETGEKTVTVKNLGEIKTPSNAAVEKQLGQVVVKLDKLQKAFNKDINVEVKAPDTKINWPKDPEDAIAVRLVTKDGRNFYDAMVNWVSSGGGGGSTDMTETNSKLDEIIQNTADLEITADTINLNTDGIEAKQDTGNTSLDSIKTNTDTLLTKTNPKVSSATNSAVSVGVSSTSVLSSNSSRNEFTVVNDSDTVIYLKLGTSAALNSGIRLNAAGGSYTNSTYTGAVTAISSGSSKTLTVVEM